MLRGFCSLHELELGQKFGGCGLHIAQALEGLSLEQICACDDDKDSEHSWATVLNPPSMTRPTTIPRYPMPYGATSSLSSSSTTSYDINSTTGSSVAAAAAMTCHPSADDDASPSETTHHSVTSTPPDPIQYKLSKISATSATTAALRMAAQAEALEELKRLKRQKDQELKAKNQGALQKLLQGLSEVDEGDNDDANESKNTEEGGTGILKDRDVEMSDAMDEN
ncbi:hypothetical protein BG004_000785 [Podila humilis]|nr:hypothetical protein BG004_000785 [Podila humilis]